MMPIEKKEPRALMRKGSAIFDSITSTIVDQTPDSRDLDAYTEAFSVYSWVYAAIKTIADNAASVPLLLFEVVNEEYIEIIDHPILTVLNKPNTYTTGYQLRQKTHAYIEATGNAFWELVRNGAGIITEIYCLNTKNVVIKPGKSHIDHYEYTVNGKTKNIPAENVIHFKNIDINNDFWGQSVLSATRDALVQEKNSIQWNKNFFLNSARPDVVFHVNGPLSKVAFARMKAMVKKLYGGVEKAHSAAIIEGGVKVETLGFAQKDMEFLSLRKYNRDEILACCGTPPSMVGVYESSIRANAAEQRRFFWETTMVQRLMNNEATLNQMFLPLFKNLNGNGKFLLMHDLTSVEGLGEATDAKTVRLGSAVTNGILTRNEARDELGYEKLEGLDTIYIPFGNNAISGNDKQEEAVEEEEQPEEEQQTLSITPSGFNSKEKKETIWKTVDDRRESFIHDANKETDKYFARLLERTLEKLDNVKGSKLKKLYEKVLNVDVIYSDKKETDLLNKMIEKQITSSLKVSGNIAMIEIGVDIGIVLNSFNSGTKTIQKFIKDNAFDHATSISDTTKSKLQKQLEIALENEESIDEVKDRIKKVLGSDITDARAKIIAENEVGTAFNAGRRFATEQIIDENPDIKLFKIWISARDERVRTTHYLNDEVSNLRPLDIDKEYPNGLMYPKDPSGPADEVINCRCVESYVSASKVAKQFGDKFYRVAKLTIGNKKIRIYNSKYETRKEKMQRMFYRKCIE